MRVRPGLHAAFLVAVVIATCGCVWGAGLETANNSLPTASAALHWATIGLPRGSYCWKTGGHGECADSAGVEQLVRTGYLKPYRTAGGFDVTITFHAASQPKSFNMQLVQSPDGEFPAVNESSPRTFSIGMSPPAKAGLYVYVVTGTWSEGDVGFYLTLQVIPGGA